MNAHADIAVGVERGIARFVVKVFVIVALLVACLAVVIEQFRISANDRASQIAESEAWKTSQQAALDAAWAVQMDEWRAAFAAQADEYQRARDLAIQEGRPIPSMPEPIREPKRPEISASSWPGWSSR